MTATVWNPVTTEFFGRLVCGWYVIENDMVTVKTARGEKGTQLYSHSLVERLAERLLRELAAQGRA
jgi:hypothetical protein